jgi:DNA-binding transcriptional MocR family regulator
LNHPDQQCKRPADLRADFSAASGLHHLRRALGRDALPSIRALAKDLRISVITTKRAYDELERDGFIYTLAGKGCYVAEKNVEMIRKGGCGKSKNRCETSSGCRAHAICPTMN